MHATDWDERYRSVDLVWGAEPNQFVREQCQRLPVGVAVDLACGEGRNALWLARQGWKVTGVDYSSVAVDRARQLTAHEPPMVGLRLDWRVEDITMAPLEPSSVDLALLSYVHLSPEAATALLSSAAGAVRPGGHLLIVGHDLRNIAEGVSGPQDPDLLYTPEGSTAALEQLGGLTVEVARTVQRSTSDGIALDTLVRARRRPVA